MVSSTHLTAIDGGVSAETSEPSIGSQAWASKIRKEARTLAKNLDTAYLQLAEKLWLVYDTPVEGDPARGSVCTAWKDQSGKYYRSFDSWVEAELGIHAKKAGRLRLIWKTLKVDLDLPNEALQRVVKLGMSKVRELARPGVLTASTVDAWVAKAEQMSVVTLSATIQKYTMDREIDAATAQAEASFEQEQAFNGGLACTPTELRPPSQGLGVSDTSPSDEDKKIENLEVLSKQFNCVLLGDQIETVNLALKRSMALSSSDKVGHNLSLICLDFLMTNDFGFASEEQRLRFLAKFEKLTQYKMILVDQEKNDIVYGFSTLEKFAKGYAG
jgi:hypothetical protein